MYLGYEVWTIFYYLQNIYFICIFARNMKLGCNQQQNYIFLSNLVCFAIDVEHHPRAKEKCRLKETSSRWSGKKRNCSVAPEGSLGKSATLTFPLFDTTVYSPDICHNEAPFPCLSRRANKKLPTEWFRQWRVGSFSLCLCNLTSPVVLKFWQWP